MNRFFLDPCPDDVWQQLPGGPVAWNDYFGAEWQYTGSVAGDDGQVRHEFRHRNHPLYDGARVYAHVVDGDTGPRLGRVAADGREVLLPGSPPHDEGDWEALPDG